MDRNEAIKIVKSHYPANKQMLNEALEFLIPELKESEDERIRKWIINEIKIKHHNLDEDNVDFVDKAIAWLEKQGEKNPAWSEETDNDAWMNDIISKVENNLQLNKAEIDWLKSIKQRYTLKPSDEQTDNLNEEMLYNEKTLKTDEEMLKAAICLIKEVNNDTCHGGFACNGIHKDDVINWLEDMLACF